MIKIFWVEDQSHWIEKFRPLLERSNFAPGAEGELAAGENNRLEVFRFAEPALARIAQTDAGDAPHIAILDASLNGNDDGGFSVSKALLKKWPALPIVFLSEHSGTGIEQKAFEEGVTQDFIAKHQRNIEGVLLWRMKALLRQSLQPVANKKAQLVSGDLRIDLVSWEVWWQGNKLMNPANPARPLAPTPRKILRFLVEASPRPLTTMQMADLLEADIEKFSYASYRQHIKILRHSMAAAHGHEQEFMDQCRAGRYIATFGDEGAYCWKPL
ncbi:response regulator [Venatoribacter cucullus]|uniref:Response regulator n=1 Tax=Venatoribacter cucullus TaxID=2661630 RepID=A0A9X7UXX6_9GAMM|nr:DNA-binding response regulator [Venatoribacter cucullus]QQD24948.1 response regulator [Venatoribacter cucullus]